MSKKDKHVGFVVVQPVWYERGGNWNCFEISPIKVMGIRYLNRAVHLDRVYVKFSDWAQWGVAGEKAYRNEGIEIHEAADLAYQG